MELPVFAIAVGYIYNITHFYSIINRGQVP